MPVYRYRAITLEGKAVVGMMPARSREEAIGRTRQRFPAVTGIRRTGRMQRSMRSSILFRPGDKAIAVMCNRLSIILGSGMPTSEAIRLAADQSRDRTMGGMLRAVSENMETGLGLAASFAESADWVPQELVEVVRAGEESGSLPEAFASLESYFEKRARVSSKILNSAIYPIIVFICSIVVGTFVTVMVVPRFMEVFSGLDRELPFATRVLMGISNFVTQNPVGLLAGAALVAVLFAVLYLRRREMFSRVALRLPVLGKLLRAQGSWQFAGAMAAMLAGGTQVTRALEVTSRAVSNRFIGGATARMCAELESGRGLGECMEKSRAFPAMLTELVYAGEQSGSLGRVLEAAARYYEEDVAMRTERLLALLEPLMLLIVGGMVLMLLLAVYVPMLTLYGEM